MSERVINIKGAKSVLFYNSAGLPLYVEAIKDGKKYFYRRFKKSKRFLKINFPCAGNYYINFDYEKIKYKPLEAVNFIGSLPQKERNREKNIKVMFNPELKGTPARIYTDLGLIEIGAKFNKLSLSEKAFVLLHEYGHFFYKTEYKTDLFALYHFIRIGFNPSSAFNCLKDVLGDTPESNKRILNLYSQIFKNYK